MSSRVALALIIVLAGGLRFWALGAGAPYRVAVDEPFLVATAVEMMKSGDFNPHFFDYGGLVIYLDLIAASTRFLIGAMGREWSSLDNVWDGNFYVAARTVTAFFGTLTVLLVYSAARRWSVRAGLVGAAAMAVHQQHVALSHFALTDVPLTFFAMLTLLLTIRGIERPSLARFFLAGLAVGAAAATKYNGALLLMLPLLAALHGRWTERTLAHVAVVMAGGLTGFLIGAPYSVLDLPGFLNGFASLMQHYNRASSATDAAIVYVKHLRNWFGWVGVLPLDIGWAALAVTLIGLVGAGLFWPGRRAIALVLVTFPLLYLWFLSNHGSLLYGRYALPLTPMLAIGFGLGVETIADRLRARQPRAATFVPLVAVLLLVPSMCAAIAWNAMHARTATAEQAGAWIVQHLPAGARIATEGQAVRLPATFRIFDMTRLIDEPLDTTRGRRRVEYLVTSTTLSDRFSPRDRASYEELLQASTALMEFPGSVEHPGPTISIRQFVP